MAYQEETASSPDDVINKIASFAQTNGWTIDRNTLSGSNRTLTLRKGTDYIHLWNTTTTDIRITGSIGYDGAQAPGSAQPNWAGQEKRANIGNGPYTRLYLFASDAPSSHVHAVIEMANGIFGHISFGMLRKYGTWTGGTYYDATYWQDGTNAGAWEGSSSHSPLFDAGHANAGWRAAVRCDVPADGQTNAWAILDVDLSYRIRTGLTMRTGREQYVVTQFYNRNNPPFSGQVTLGTLMASVSRPSGLWSPIGEYPNVRYLNMARFSPGQEISIGSDVWKIFPMRRKGTGSSGSTEPYSSDHGYAFKKVP